MTLHTHFHTFLSWLGRCTVTSLAFPHIQVTVKLLPPYASHIHSRGLSSKIVPFVDRVGASARSMTVQQHGASTFLMGIATKVLCARWNSAGIASIALPKSSRIPGTGSPRGNKNLPFHCVPIFTQAGLMETIFFGLEYLHIHITHSERDNYRYFPYHGMLHRSPPL